ncbi:MAG: hypothetical protein KA327_09665, partial [Pseudarcicella sp.]|nr:hypothetical protein [Pseudarcicella sp.]
MKNLILITLFSLIQLSLFAQKNTFTCGFDDASISAETLHDMQNIGRQLSAKASRKNAITDFNFCRVAVDIDFDTYSKYRGDTLYIKNEVAEMINKISKIYEREILTKLVVVHVNIRKTKESDPYDGLLVVSELNKVLKKEYSTGGSMAWLPCDIATYLNTKGFTGAGGLASGKHSTSPWGNLSTIAHEIGHSFGSPHTQSCNWAGGPLDFCYATEGDCYDDGLENIKGTIMSYCSRDMMTFHPTCIELMRKKSVTYGKVASITQAPKLKPIVNFNTEGFYRWDYINLAEQYFLELASDSSFTNIIVRDTVEQACVMMNYLKKNQTYYLRIKASNRLSQGQWSNRIIIKTPEELLDAPQPLTLLNGTINAEPTNTELKYSPVESANIYNIQYIYYSTLKNGVSLDRAYFSGTFSGKSVHNVYQIGTSRILKDNVTGDSAEAIIWRVRAMKGIVPGQWSNTQIAWFKPKTHKIDLQYQAINNIYPTRFPINYTANAGDVLEVRMKLSENSDMSQPIVTKTWPITKYAGQVSYPYMFENLKHNTQYYISFEEHNTVPIDVIGLPKGLVKTVQRSFKTQVDTIANPNFDVYNNSSVSKLSRSIKDVVFYKDYVFVNTKEGIVRMKKDGTQSILYDRTSTNGNITNTLLDMKVSAKGELWTLSKVSRRMKFSGVFPRQVYRLSQIEPETFKILSSIDVNGGIISGIEASFNTFDPNTKTLSNERVNFHKIQGDTTFPVITHPADLNFKAVQWGNGNAWLLYENKTTEVSEIRNFDFTTNMFESFSSQNTILNKTIDQIFLDKQNNLWVLNQGSSPLLKYNITEGWKSIPGYNLKGRVTMIGENNGKLYFNVVSTTTPDAASATKEIFTYDATKGFVKFQNIPFKNSVGSFEIDETGKVWFWQEDKILKMNNCKPMVSPVLTANKQQILSGESIAINSKGCKETILKWNENNNQTTTVVPMINNLVQTMPLQNGNYSAICELDGCQSLVSNVLTVSVFDLKINTLDKNKYCYDENIELKPTLIGSFGNTNQLNAVLFNNQKNITLPVISGAKLNVTNDIPAGNYFVKLQTNAPAFVSKDSVQVTIFPRPTAQISGLKNVLLPDSVKIKIDFTGQKPFTFDLNNKIFTSNTEQFSYKVLEKLPQKYIYTISNFKDANCSNGFVAKDSVQIDVDGNA